MDGSSSDIVDTSNTVNTSDTINPSDTANVSDTMSTTNTVNTLDIVNTSDTMYTSDTINPSDTAHVSDTMSTPDTMDASIAMGEYTYTFNEYTYEFDIYEKKLVNNCDLYPSLTNKNDFRYLCAVNNKYSGESIEPEKVGKWVVVLPKDCIDAAWDKIKMTVTRGELWRVEVSTSNPRKLMEYHRIMVYTRDYTDLDDLVSVLDCLEKSGIKLPNVRAEYKVDSSCRWRLYTSDTIRNSYLRRIRWAMQDDKYSLLHQLTLSKRDQL